MLSHTLAEGINHPIGIGHWVRRSRGTNTTPRFRKQWNRTL